MAVSPFQESGNLLSYSIQSGPTSISDNYLVFSISITKSLNKIPTAVIQIQDGDLTNMEFPATNSDVFAPGKEIEISLGYNSSNSTVFSGIVVGQKVSLNSSGPVLEVTCKDKAVKMTVGRKSNTYPTMTDSDIITKLISDNGVTPDVDSTTKQNKELVQHMATDWDFMMTRSELNGMFVLVDQGTVGVKKPTFSTDPVLSLTYGIDIIDFNAELNATSQLSSVTSKSWDYTTQTMVEVNGEVPTVNSQGNLDSSTLSSVIGATEYQLQSSGLVEEADLKTWASTQLLKASLSRITGSVSFTGSALINPGDMLELAGVSARFNGNAFVSGVSHSISEGDWTTSVEFGVEEEWFSQKPFPKSTGAGGATSSVAGLMNGKVKQLDQDPDGQYRILLTFPLMPQVADGIWARMATFYATNGQGIFFLPEIDDEVVVGFMDNDPQFPVILGSLYSQAIKSPNEPTAENYTKAIITKSECKISFDDENKVITITTPGNNNVVYSDKDKGITITDQNNNTIKMGTDGITIQDKNNNTITMSSSGIDIKSDKDITLKGNNISLTSNSNTSIKATGDFTGSGMGVSLTANSTLKASGTASTEVSSSGNTSIKGTMVMIN